ncbi:MAG: phosphate ABC transporter permease subunit PstC [SAR202 cluster bacterium]|nr:phosphate ABC transporter permease subunit PstC [Chloroflexota bacterium]MBS34196.1 phosphate ABC transporter permease subunit PstC [Verrucomicrobiales bacterium]MQF94763.1 phosphate ABC transporter permease subunit PstC [SAR202 cluster bacterium]HAA95621.1 phosphate ABC transporter permease subunit PstC [Dehalococcoidia bacterium]MQG33848.1 phosphate ABC transporter permease subunit PstC [SAR202 cluster bacterium]|tara:strand:+ start:12072 stop:12944 length:873 start_codon:yes stop_codon:yes gene_type:complete
MLPERAIALFLFLCSFLSILTTVGIVFVLLFEAIQFFVDVSFWEFITGTRWTPLFSSKQFGVLALVAGTALTAVLAMVVALPLGLLSAIYLSEYAPDPVRRTVKPILEVLAGIPTVVYGYFALLFVTPILRGISEDIAVFNALSAAIVMGIMILPMVSSLSEDAMRAVPRTLREGAYALGSTKLEVSTLVVVPAALSGIVSAFILAISRAIGETMIVTIAAGQNPNFTLNPFVPIETMTAYIVQVSQGDAPTGSIEFKTIFAVALLLFAITLGMNLLSQWVVSRFREEYE